MQGAQQFGIAPGAKQMMTWEFQHADEAIKSGLYVTWRSPASKDDCFRVGSNSRCFCGHMFTEHEIPLSHKKVSKTNCSTCPCKGFKFIPRRPEEVGMDWLPRRKGFNVLQWRPSCKCKHTHEEHQPTASNKCKSCSCFSFVSDFCCISCDRPYEEHETLYEFEDERKLNKLPTGELFRPLSKDPDV